MKYWFFDGSDVTGPFSLQELLRQKSFGEMSLVCPENYSDDGDHWQPAASFDDFKPFFAHEAPPDENTSSFDQEMNTLLKERSPLAFDETPSEGPGLQIPKKPAKPGPIEDYFDRVKEEDLGDILGIPNPNENSDMDLAHALEKQLAKTSSTRRKEYELDSETDEQTVAELKKANETHHVATVTEVFNTKAPVATQDPAETTIVQATALKEDTPSMPVVESPSMPVVATPAPTTTAKVTTTPETTFSTQPDATATHAPAEKESTTRPAIVPDPAQLRREKVEVNSVRARLKQTQEMKDFLRETQNNRLKKEAHSQNRWIVMFLTGLAIIGGVLWAFQRNTPSLAAKPATTATSVAPTVQELLAEPVKPVSQATSAPTVVRTPPATVNVQTTSQEQKALEIVKNYPLSGQRGTLANYLNRIYQNQLSQGYTGTWAAAPLHKNLYIVKYQLTKTRKEPIVYVFQADVAQGKLTSALNNISIDLVGKL